MLMDDADVTPGATWMTPPGDMHVTLLMTCMTHPGVTLTSPSPVTSASPPLSPRVKLIEKVLLLLCWFIVIPVSYTHLTLPTN